MDTAKYHELSDKLKKHENPLSCLFVWVKTGHINQKEFMVLNRFWAEYIHESEDTEWYDRF